MTRNEIKEKVHAVLFIYDSNPIKTKPLCAVCSITPRQLQTAIRDLRMDGVKVCSGDAGYWLWNGKDDSWEHTKRQLRSRVSKLMRVLIAMDMELEGQEKWDLNTIR